MPIKRLLVLAWLAWATHAFAAAPTPISTFCTAAPDQCRKGTMSLLTAKGTTDNVEYMVEIDTTTGALAINFPAGATIGLTEDHNYGAVGANTLRTAAQIGNATGAATFGTGASSAQTLRVMTASDADIDADIRVGGVAVANANPVPISDAGSSITVDGTVAATQGTSPWVVSGTAAVTQTTSPWVIDGTVAATQSGAWSTGRTWTLSSGSDAVSSRTQDGAGNLITSTGSKLDVAAAQNGTWTVQPGNTANTTAWLVNEGGHTYSDSVRNDYSSTAVTTGAWVQMIASTAAAITQLYVDDTCGEILELGTGAALSETRKLLIPRGGLTAMVNLAIPAGTRVSLRAVSGNCSTGDFVATGLL